MSSTGGDLLLERHPNNNGGVFDDPLLFNFCGFRDEDEVGDDTDWDDNGVSSR